MDYDRERQHYFLITPGHLIDNKKWEADYDKVGRRLMGLHHWQCRDGGAQY
jgi:hypothetical protein